jgi:hypothetical protein
MTGPDKFHEFDRLCREVHSLRVDTVLVSDPTVLGDTYAELVANLRKLAAARLALLISPPATTPPPAN